jgi:hypothetical protein
VKSSKVRHILSLSGGKDSAALAVYLRDKLPDIEYVFCDTEKELPETEEYMNKLTAYLGKPITVLKHDGRTFDHWLVIFNNYLPSPQMRWCTRHLKLTPFEKYVGNDKVVSYIGIRADEDREGYISTKTNIAARYPFKEDGLVKQDIYRLLDEAGLGLPEYYRWRSRSGCYFCFFQQKIEWVGLLENHPKYFELAKEYEKTDPKTGERYTWSESESLAELSRPERVAQIKAEHETRISKLKVANKNSGLLVNIFAAMADEVDDRSCLICRL